MKPGIFRSWYALAEAVLLVLVIATIAGSATFLLIRACS